MMNLTGRMRIEKEFSILNPPLLFFYYMGDDRNSVGIKRRRLFSPHDDRRLARIIRENVFTGWKNVAKQMPGFTAKQLRDRWNNYLSPKNSFQPWSPEEDRIITEKVKEFGTKWSRIATFLHGRSDNSIKNRWNTILKDQDEANKAPNTLELISSGRNTSNELEDNSEEIQTKIPEVKPANLIALDDRFIKRFFDTAWLSENNFNLIISINDVHWWLIYITSFYIYFSFYLVKISVYLLYFYELLCFLCI